MVEAQLFLQLLVRLLEHPPRFDGSGELSERRVGEVVFTGAVRAVFSQG